MFLSSVWEVGRETQAEEERKSDSVVLGNAICQFNNVPEF
jgi:hypothetical protein